MIKIIYRNIHDKSVQLLESSRVGVWVHVEEPTTEDIENIEKQYHLDKSLLTDAIDPYEVPRMEVENGASYIFSRYPIQKGAHITTSPILIIVAGGAVITVSREKIPQFDELAKTKTFFTTQKTKLFLQLFQAINVSYNHYLLNISRQITSAYDLEHIRNQDIAQFVNYERIISEFHFALVRTNTVLNSLLSHNYIKLYEIDRDLMEDLFLNNDQLIQIATENLKSIVTIRNAYSTIINNNTNRVIRFFTSITVILTIPTIAGSLYGMNISLPFGTHPYAFFGVIGITLTICTVLVIMFLKKDWL